MDMESDYWASRPDWEDMMPEQHHRKSLTGWPEHAEHGRWKRIAPCVYCACGERLYQGKPPRDRDGQREMAAAMEAIISKRQP